MSALENLPPDQRAVLQMVLQRSRSYDEIAALLSIERASVRQRALDAFDALAPVSVLPGPESALVTDYLLGQLPEKVAEQVYSYLQASDADRAWAEAVADVVGPLASAPLPEIPVGAPLGADDRGAGEIERHSDPYEPVAEQSAAVAQEQEPYEQTDDSYAQPAATPAAAAPAAADPWRRGSDAARTPERRDSRRSSRRGGAILLSTIGVVIVAVVVIVALGSGGTTKQKSGGSSSSTTTPAQSTSTTVATGTSTGAGSAAMLVQLNLSSPVGAKSTLGIAQVIRDQGVIGVAILAQGVPANTAHNAYAVWLYNSPSSFKFVGFVSKLVTKTGKLSAEGELPAGASGYHKLLITLETQSKPTSPGQVVLSGPFREHP